MLPVLTAAEMRAVDARAIAELGIPGPRLMESAGTGAAALIARTFAPVRGKRVAIVCGKGNNGGDGFVVARRLSGMGARVEVYLVARRAEVRGDAAAALGRWRGRVEEIASDADVGRLAARLARADLVVDALLGTGITGPARGATALVIEAVNACGRPVVALDLPSGLGADDGALLGPTITAGATATFAAHKRSLLLHPGAAQAGRVSVIDIGVPAGEVGRGVTTFLLEAGDIRPSFPARAADSHKGTFGHLLVVAGSRGRTGAAALAARAALRTGAGLCTVATPASQQPVVAGLGLEYMTEALPETASGALALAARDRVLDLASRCDAVALGPGLSLDPESQALARLLIREVAQPMLVDADALTALTGHLGTLDDAAGPRALTPHPGEMGRMLGVTAAAVQADRLETARAFAARHRVGLALKGAGTAIAGPDGVVWINPTGNPGMASGGSGDVLTGVAGALLARGFDAVSALRAGCFLHGRAGDVAAAARGIDGLLAGDTAEAIPAAIASRRAGPV